jgi:hypothetical protein
MKTNKKNTPKFKYTNLIPYFVKIISVTILIYFINETINSTFFAQEDSSSVLEMFKVFFSIEAYLLLTIFGIGTLLGIIKSSRAHYFYYLSTILYAKILFQLYLAMYITNYQNIRIDNPFFDIIMLLVLIIFSGTPALLGFLLQKFEKR